MKLSQLHQKILLIIVEKGALQSSYIYNDLQSKGAETSLITVKRNLSTLVANKYLSIKGGGKYTKYEITTQGRVFLIINPSEYTKVEPDKRIGFSGYNFSLFSEMPKEVFDADELIKLKEATANYKIRTRGLSDIVEKQELQRLVIELSWKSSKIEGNTYTLLDTEKLLIENKEAPGHDKSESKMILNHKDAFNFIRENPNYFKKLTPANLEKLHSLLTKSLGVKTGLRKSLVGVTGSKYRPLDNVYQIKEAVSSLSLAVSKAKTPYTKAIIALSGISYIQPFEDGNKRTGRLMANALLISHGCAPLSYRSISIEDYREAMLTFYELNSIVPFKKIFIEQYLFAAKNYSI